MSSDCLHHSPRVVGRDGGLRSFNCCMDAMVAWTYFGSKDPMKPFIRRSDQPLLLHIPFVLGVFHAIAAPVHTTRKPRDAAALKVLQRLLFPPKARPGPFKVDVCGRVFGKRLLQELIDMPKKTSFLPSRCLQLDLLFRRFEVHRRPWAPLGTWK